MAYFLAQPGGDALQPETVETYREALAPWLAWCAAAGLTNPRAVSPDQYVLGAFVGVAHRTLIATLAI